MAATATTQIFFLKGEVKLVLKTATSGEGGREIRFIVESMSNQKKYICHCEYFTLIQEGDLVMIRATMENDHQRIYTNMTTSSGIQPDTILKLCTTPVVVLGSKKETIRQIFSNRIPMAYVRTDACYEHIHSLALDAGKTVDAFLNHIAEQWNSLHDKSVFTPFSLFFKEEKATKFFRWWYKNRNLRRFYVLGLTNKEIREGTKFLSLDQMYEKCITNPCEIVQLSMEKCKSLMTLQNIPLSADQELSYLLVRKFQGQLDQKGWMCMPIQQLFFEWNREFQFSDEMFSDRIAKLSSMLTRDGDYIYPNREYQMEVFVAKKIAQTITHLPKGRNVEKMTFFNDKLNECQKNAVRMALLEPVVIITGGAGTGKTVCISEITQQLDHLQAVADNPVDYNYEIVSPTGKAAARIREMLHEKKASTIHRLLKEKFNKATQFVYLIIDETSMVTTELMFELYNTFPWCFRLILVGDKNQLPPIGKGAFFEQLIKSNKITIAKLEENYRSVRPSGTVNGILQNANGLLQSGENFTFQPFDNFHILKGGPELVDLVATALARANIKSGSVTSIAPYNSDLGHLNGMFQRIFQNKNPGVNDSNGVLWKLNDRVMMVTNDYTINVMNGEEGIISEIASDHVKVSFREGEVHDFLLKAPLQQKKDDHQVIEEKHGDIVGDQEEVLTTSLLIHSYVISIHRSQGSEWDYGIIYIPKRNSNGFITKELVYTALTRFKHSVWLISDDIDSISRQMQRQKFDKYDFLYYRLQQLLSPPPSNTN